MALPLFSNDFTGSELLKKAESMGFSWFYKFESTFPHALLTALGLSVIFQNMMDNVYYKNWKNREWTRAVEPILTFYQKNEQPEHAEFADIQFWTGLADTMLKFTEVVLNAAEKGHKWEQIFRERKIDEELDHSVIDILCKRLFLLVFILKASNSEPTVMSFNENSDGQRFYSTFMKEGGCLYYLGHQDFTQSKLAQLETQFPFTAAGKVDSRSVFLPELFSRPEPQKVLIEPEEEVNRATEVMKKALELVNTLVVQGAFQPPGYSELVQLCKGYAEYLRVHGKPTLNCLSLPVPKVELVDPSTGGHQILQCSTYNLRDAYQEMACGHKFHVNCLKSHWVAIYQQRASNPNAELTCPMCNCLADEASVQQVHPDLFRKITNERNLRVQANRGNPVSQVPNSRAVPSKIAKAEFTKCSGCRKQVSTKFVLRHQDTHDVCVTCLQHFTCPLCHESVNESERKIIEDVFYK